MAQEELCVRNASKSFGGVRVLKSVDLDIAPGEVIALLGENGAGKSTLLKVMAGVYRADELTMSRGGRSVTIRNVSDARECGIAMVHQELNLVGNQSVAQNIFLGRVPVHRPSALGIIDQRAVVEAAQRALTTVGSNVSPHQGVDTLSIAQQQHVEIAKALSHSDASILFLDEPTSSLPEKQTADLLALIRQLKKRGLAIVMTTHRIDEAFVVADRIVIMRDGAKIAELRSTDPDATKDNVIRLMVGRELTTLFPKRRDPGTRPVLEVEGLSGGMVKDVSFTVREGEVFGLGGLVGAGRTETIRQIFGADPREAGSVRLNGKPLALRNPRDAIRHGIGLVPEDRKTQGLTQIFNVEQNVALPSLRRWNKLGLLSLRTISKTADDLIKRLSIKVRSRKQTVALLSGGNQQKVVLAKWMACPLNLLILDEPTRGVDVGARADLYRYIDSVARQGVAVLLVTSDMEELIGLSDRIGVMAEGRLTGILGREEVSQERVLELASQLTSVV